MTDEEVRKLRAGDKLIRIAHLGRLKAGVQYKVTKVAYPNFWVSVPDSTPFSSSADNKAFWELVPKVKRNLPDWW